MSEITLSLDNSTHLKIKVYPGSILVVNLLLYSQIGEALLFRPTLDDWIVDNGNIISVSSSISPPYLYLDRESKLSQKIKLSIPFLLQPGEIIKSWLRFPGIQEEGIAIELEILLPEPEKDKSQVVEVSLPVTLPFTSPEGNRLSNAVDRTTDATFDLLSGLMDLDKIPSRWLVAEILVILCQKGEEYGQTEPGQQLLNQLKLTRFFKNGVIAFRAAQIPNWIADNLKSENTILGGYSLLYLWEQWLLKLVPSNVEAAPKKGEMYVPLLLAKSFILKLGGSTDRWLAGILLGLAQISPQIATKMKDFASGEVFELEIDRTTVATKSLLTALPGLDIFPARWLVVELLLLLSQKGDEYARTQTGSQLLAQLKPTHFLNNGVLAFAAAQLPRWLAISQQAASAYRSSVGSVPEQSGWLELGEQWMWSLMPTDSNVGQRYTELSVSDTATDAFVASLGMDAERWFGCVILGLALVSPRIAATLNAIAESKSLPSPLPTPSQETILNDVFQEGGSLQR
ncbi:hypothetical protein [Argonema antarcticum]|uniref:hypothetical protein n=1 Tax=Argonema antarcticum TaxID=2942763 RepID=UPI002010D50B|nr:hypothetical protein [Argonema antarcticum]MCL1470876.1 hypothetical protein [Argonema antarcticum A004/B2]